MDRCVCVQREQTTFTCDVLGLPSIFQYINNLQKHKQHEVEQHVISLLDMLE